MFKKSEFELTEEEQNNFWVMVKIVMEHIFQEQSEEVDFYRYQLDKGPEDEKLIVMHDDHLNIAAQIIGVRPNKEQVLYYLDLVKNFKIEYNSHKGEVMYHYGKL